MSDVFRLSKQGRIELELFKKRYLDSLQLYARSSKLCADLYNEHLNYSDSQWLEFAIRVACNRYAPEGDSPIH